jgi:membrane carboxypeptidase/penicillin-binding protein
MDNDVHGTDYCIGFSTAVTRTVNFVHQLRTSAGSHERLAVVEVFGRYSGETSLIAAYLAGVDRAIISEVPFEIDRLASLLMKDNSMENGSQLGEKAYTIVSGVDLRLQQICEEELSKGLRQVETMSEQLKPGRLAEESSSLGGFAARQARLMRIREVKPKSIVVEMSGYHGEIALPETLPYFSSSGALRPGNLIDTYIDEIHGNKIKGSLYDQSHVQGAAVLLNAKTGEILALVGGENFNDTANDGQWNRAVQGGRQPGSSWKPLLYASAFDLNGEGGQPRFTPGSVEMDEPLSVGNWSPKNWSGLCDADS